MDCTIVGAGAAGLMAALTLAKAGRSVRLLEASQRLGGRIHTLHPTGFSIPVEAGAEFVHGQLPITLQLLQEANITYVPVAGSSWQKRPEGWQKQEDETDHWEQVIQQMQTLETDMTIADFLYEYFPGDGQATLRDEVQRFAEGFDLADIFTASVFALRDEWNSEATEEYRIPGGYSQLIDHLAQQCRNLGVEILTGCRINRVAIEEQSVKMQSADGRSFGAGKAIIAISLGLLQRSADEGLSFTPAIPEYLKAFREMGYGSVVKLALEFREPFWEQQSSDIGFILSQEQIPTWWTQRSVKNNLLTGWLGGPVANSMQYTNRQVVYTQAMESLSRIFEKPVEALEEQLVAWEIFNWSADLFAAGAYSYGTLPTATALQTVMQPVAGRLWFAGEAIYDGVHPGTVEAALESGRTVAGKLL